jgi:Rrf2 family protein
MGLLEPVMIYSNACGYAIRALTRIAMVRPEGYVLLDELCDGTDIPRHFLAKIFQDLVRHGLLVSAKGRGGGFALARPPQEIALIDIVRVVDGIQDLDNCVIGMARCDDQQPCPQHDQWKAIRAQIRKFLTDTTLSRMSSTLEKKLQIIGQAPPEFHSKSKPVR